MASVSDKVLAVRASAVCRYLREHREGPISAIRLANACAIAREQNTEARRRRIREAVEYAREPRGERICADGEGYWLARSPLEWAEFLDARKAKRRFGFVRDRQCQQAVAERIGRQGMLFETRAAGVADI